jgi:WD40 repeat protein
VETSPALGCLLSRGANMVRRSSLWRAASPAAPHLGPGSPAAGLPAEGGALGVQRTGSWGTDPCDPAATAISARSSRPDGRDWFGHLPYSSRLILFWTGHGCSDGGKHYLICRGSPRDGVSTFNAIHTGAIGDILANCKAEKILVVLDTCYSGLGADDIAESLGKSLATRTQAAGQERAFAVIASAHSLEEAKEAVFSSALRTALFEPNLPPDQREWTDRDEFIHTDALCSASIRLMSHDLSRPQYLARGPGQRFIPNPLYRAGRPAENVEERSWQLWGSDEAEHFSLAARGIEVGEKGWFFAGRKKLLRRLVNWVKSAQHGVRIVTGPPGAGKSAVIGRLATMSDAHYRREAVLAGLAMEGDDNLPPVGSIDVAVHAKGRTLEDRVDVLAEGLGVTISKDRSIVDSKDRSIVDSLVEGINKIDRTITVVVDALDEAVAGQGAAIAENLLVRLAHLPHVRVLVGSRRSLDGSVIPDGEDRHGRLHAAFGGDAVIDDLADETDAQEDIAHYVRLRLSGCERHRNENPGTIAAAAARVAERADGVFLYARIVSRTLQERDSLEGELPATALDAFEQDLDTRFQGEKRRVNDLLGALAWGEGKGLTRRVWPLVANAVANRGLRYKDDDVAWALGHAGWHIIEAEEDGQTVYRLAHQALADHYRDAADEKEAQGHIVSALSRGIQGAGWLNCDNYVWRHLANHAANAERLDELIRDPGYLAVADPDRLVILLSSIESAQGRRIADIYDRTYDGVSELKRRSPIERMPLIHMRAQFEDPDLAPAPEPPVPARWRCRWAVIESMPHRVIGRHGGFVNCVALYAIDETIIASAGTGRTVRRWDARTGRQIGEPLEGHADEVKSLAFGIVDGTPIIISGSEDNTICRWDARTGQRIGRPLEGHTETVASVASGVVNGTPMIISGGNDTTIRRWDARTGQPIGRPSQPLGVGTFHAAVTSIAFGEVYGNPIIFAPQRGRLQYCDPRTGTSLWIPTRRRTHKGAISSIVFGVVDGTPMIVSGSADKTLCRWDVRTGKVLGKPLEGHTDQVISVAFGMVDATNFTLKRGTPASRMGRQPTGIF